MVACYIVMEFYFLEPSAHITQHDFLVNPENHVEEVFTFEEFQT